MLACYHTRERVDSACKVGKPSVNASQLAACLSVDEQHLGFGATQEVLLASASAHHTGFNAVPLKLHLYETSPKPLNVSSCLVHRLQVLDEDGSTEEVISAFYASFSLIFKNFYS